MQISLKNLLCTHFAPTPQWLHYLLQCRLQLTYAEPALYHIPFMISRECSEPGEGTNGWTITKLLSGTSPNKNFVIIRAAPWKFGLKWRTFPLDYDITEKQNKALSSFPGHLPIKIKNFLIAYCCVLCYFLLIEWLFSVLWCNVDEDWIAWIGSSYLLVISVFVPYLTMGRKCFLCWSGMSPLLLHTPFTRSSVLWGCSHNYFPPCVTQNSFPVAGVPVLDERSKMRNMVPSITSFHQYLFQNTTSSLMEGSYLVLFRFKEKTNQPWLTLFLGPCFDRERLNKTSIRRKGCGLWWLILSHKYKSVRVVPHHTYQALPSLSRAGSPQTSPEEAGHPLLTLHLGDRRWFCMSSNSIEKNPKHITGAPIHSLNFVLSCSYFFSISRDRCFSQLKSFR